ncbi:ROK family transcriptional regulator [Litorisediminicola beolgyonensis]|uniref:ROK family protein n=1 Tax=Litorisediminicola beolgyonensis TaxID=1173614 RepID=A0ABW3ZFT6_9RHOB
MTDAARPLRQQIFERVRAAGRLSRTETARALGISPATVTTLSSDLIAEGLLEEVATPRPDSARGRPRVALGVRGPSLYTAGVKLADRDCSAVITDFAGTVIASGSEPARPGAVPLAALLDRCRSVLEAVAADAGLRISDFAAVGIGVPGFVEHETGQVHWSPILQDSPVDLASAARTALGVPVVIDNDANLVTLAELWFGKGRGRADFAVITIEHGVGMGLVLNHRLFRGARGLGTELGHTKVQLDGALCRCGQRGCLEAYVADYALAREAATALKWDETNRLSMALMLESLFDHAKAGNIAARSIFHRAGRYLALGLANVINVFDPSLVILSGERMRYDYLYSDKTLSELDGLVLRTERPVPPVEVHAWGDLLWAHGAAALALSYASERRLELCGSEAAE